MKRAELRNAPGNTIPRIDSGYKVDQIVEVRAPQ